MKNDTTLTTQEKWDEIKKLQRTASLEMRSLTSFYVLAGMEHPEGQAMLIGHYGDGPSPAEAIEDHWRLYADGKPFYVRTPDKWFVRSGGQWIPTVDPRTIPKTPLGV